LKVWIPKLTPEEFPIKRCVGDSVRVRADIFADGHDQLGARLLYRRAEDSDWREAAMRLIANDRWEAEFNAKNSASM